MGNGANIEGSNTSQLNFPSGSTVNFQGTANAVTITDTIKNNRIATLKYVSDLFQSSISTISANYVKRGGSTGAIGSSVKPVYINADGNAVAISNNVVTRGNNTTEGSTTRFVYMNGGSITPSTGTVGNDGKTIVYLNNGTLTASNVNVGIDNEGKTITYLKSGKITQSTATVGSDLVPIYLKNGVLTQISNTTIGGEYLPIYIKGGSLTACKREIPSGSGGGGGGVTSVTVNSSLNVASGNNFIKTLTSSTDGNGRVTITGTTVRLTIANIDGLETKHTNFTNSLAGLNSSCAGFNSSCANLVSSLAKYAPKFGVKVTGTGNVISSVAFENSSASINLQKNVTALTAASTSGTGTVLTNLSYSGSTVTATKGYPPISISYTGSGNAIDGLSYSNGTITANKTNISGGGGYPPSDYLIVEEFTGNSMTINHGKAGTASATVSKAGYTAIGIVGVCVNTSPSNVLALHLIEFHMSGNSAQANFTNRAGSTNYTFTPSFYVLMKKN